MKNNFKEEKDICQHLGDEYGDYFGAVVPPIFQNSLFVFKDYESMKETFVNERESYLYTLGNNPTVDILEKKLAALDHGEACKVFGSGMAAITAAIDNFTKSGDHILFLNNIYGGTMGYADYLAKYNISYSAISTTDIAEIEKEIKENTTLIFFESPGTMTLNMVDINEVVKLAKSRDIKTIIDSTWTTPLFLKPLDYGVDVVVYSCSKYISGHSDVIAGAMISSKEIMDKVFFNEYLLRGGCIGPFDAWLLIRGLRTLPARMKSHQESAIKVARFLENHKNIDKVNYPALESSPYYEIGKKQLKGYSGVFSFVLKTDDLDVVKKVVEGCKIFKLGVSWGGHESLILPINYGRPDDKLKDQEIDLGLIRLSVGLEDVDDLIEDLERALDF